MAIDFDKLDAYADEEKEATLNLAEFKQAVDAWSKIVGEIEAVEAQLKALKEQERVMSETTIPDMLAIGGIRELPLSDGRKIEVKDELFVSMPKSRLHEIMQDVRERGGGDLIKNEMRIALDKGKDNIAAEIEHKAIELGLEVERSETIAPQTYKKWLKTRMETGESVDLPFYGAYNVTKAKLK